LLKKYQPGRTDLLINTDWGIPLDGLTKEEARSKSMLLFHKRWVTKAEKKQLKDEQNAYLSIRTIGFILLFVSVPIVVNIGRIAQSGILSVLLAVIYILVSVAAGIGLIRYARFARYLAVLIVISFFMLPFTELLEDEKGAPLLFILGMMGLYYLLRRTARKIFWPQTRSKSDDKKIRPVVRSVIYGITLLAGLSAGYLVYDFSQARKMAAEACRRATAGMPLEEFLSNFPEGDYKIIRGSDDVLIVPKKGMGRNHCIVTHDGRNITGAKTGFND
jgi:hypothetical protein